MLPFQATDRNLLLGPLPRAAGPRTRASTPLLSRATEACPKVLADMDAEAAPELLVAGVATLLADLVTLVMVLEEATRSRIVGSCINTCCVPKGWIVDLASREVL